MTHVTCRLTAKNRDQLRNPTLGNRVWATFTFFTVGDRVWATFTYLNATSAFCTNSLSRKPTTTRSKSRDPVISAVFNTGDACEILRKLFISLTCRRIRSQYATAHFSAVSEHRTVVDTYAGQPSPVCTANSVSIADGTLS